LAQNLSDRAQRSRHRFFALIVGGLRDPGHAAPGAPPVQTEGRGREVHRPRGGMGHLHVARTAGSSRPSWPARHAPSLAGQRLADLRGAHAD
jgi:hypothetical protein